MLTLTRPVNYPPANSIRLWIAELSYEMSLARKILKLAQEFEETQPAGCVLIPTTTTPSAPNAR